MLTGATAFFASIPMETKLYITKNDLSCLVRSTMISLLNQQLADTLDLGRQAKQAHWNAKGPNFFGLHELFDQIAGTLEEYSDALAERTVALGGTALGTVQMIACSSRLPAYPLETTTGRGHLASLTHAMASVGATTRAAIESAAQAGDADTADLLTEISRGLDKLLWKIEAHQQSAD
jgi:starvation-inducible DNA-binding protein